MRPASVPFRLRFCPELFEVNDESLFMVLRFCSGDETGCPVVFVSAMLGLLLSPTMFEKLLRPRPAFLLGLSLSSGLGVLSIRGKGLV